MCCNGECPSTKSRCRCDCTRCRHCGKCGHQDGPGIGLLIAGVVGALAVATVAEKTSRRRPWEEEVRTKRHLARRAWERTESECDQTPDHDKEDDVFYTDSNGNYSAGPSACKPSIRRQRQISTSSTASAASQVSISSTESQSSRTNRRNATMRRRSSTARSSASVRNECTIQ